MHKGEDFSWLFLDINSYFASIEQHMNPQLRGKPVIVIPTDTDFTCVIAASYEAKLYGIKTGTSVRDAKKMCPNLCIILAQHEKYMHYHHRIVYEVSKHIPINTIHSIDELSSCLPPAKRSAQNTKNLAQKIKNDLHENIGPAINCSIGIAPNSLLAKIASDYQKPNGFTIITHDTLNTFHAALHLRDIPGIGHNMHKRLQKAQITTLTQLCALPPKHMRKIWGNVHGERLWYLLHGYDIPESQTENRYMIGHSRVLSPQHRSVDGAKKVTQRLTEKALQRLRGEGLYCAKITFSCRYDQIFRWHDEVCFPHTQDTLCVLGHINTLWQHFTSATHARDIKKTSISLQKLQHPNNITDDLFSQPQPQHDKNKKLNQALDYLQKKYKQNIVTIGAPLHPKDSAQKEMQIGGKIAFSRIPEQHEFW